jgi:3-dehydroquinate dehydratase/shikimate dehydrogenase
MDAVAANIDAVNTLVCRPNGATVCGAGCYCCITCVQEAALQLADSVDPVAARIGAINTLVRQPDGTLRGYNTDAPAAIGAIEAALGGAAAQPLRGRTFVVAGAGGAGRALAFGAAERCSVCLLVRVSVCPAAILAFTTCTLC